LLALFGLREGKQESKIGKTSPSKKERTRRCPQEEKTLELKDKSKYIIKTFGI
jgi:hypothetical protein